MPHLVDFRDLGEESVATHVEVKASVVDGAGQAAYGIQLLDTMGGKPSLVSS